MKRTSPDQLPISSLPTFLNARYQTPIHLGTYLLLTSMNVSAFAYKYLCLPTAEDFANEYGFDVLVAKFLLDTAVDRGFLSLHGDQYRYEDQSND